MSRARAVLLRRLCGAIALCAGVLITVATPAPYYVRTEAPLASHVGSDGSTLRFHDVLVVLPGPYTLVQAYDDDREDREIPWGGAPVVIVINEGAEPVVLRTAGVRLELGYAVYTDPDTVEHSIAPGERRSVSLTLRASDGAPDSSDADPWSHDLRRRRFRFGELVFPDGTVSRIEGSIVGVDRGELDAGVTPSEH